MGVNGGIPATIENLLLMRDTAYKLYGEETVWMVTAIGRYETPLCAHAIILGGDLRVGFEDNIYYSKGKKATSNAQLVERMVRIANDVGREIATAEEARQILRESEEAGLVHTTGNYRDGTNYICNCCTCCCGVLRGVAEFGVPTAVARSDFRAVVDEASCTGCGICVESCQFGALSLQDEVSVVDYARCLGCGLCAINCPVSALHLERRPEGEVPLPPADINEWREQRMDARHPGEQ